MWNVRWRERGQISFHIERSEIFHNFRKKIISHSALPNISLIYELQFYPTSTKREPGATALGSSSWLPPPVLAPVTPYTYTESSAIGAADSKQSMTIWSKYSYECLLQIRWYRVSGCAMKRTLRCMKWVAKKLVKQSFALWSVASPHGKEKSSS